MIRLGLTSFSEHETLTGKKRATLHEYANYLSLVEMDTAYYAIPKKERVQTWTDAVPNDFRFVMKVYSGISCQGKWDQYFSSEHEMITTFLKNMEPMVNSGKLFAFLIQFPGTFTCTKENVNYLEKIHQWFIGYPVAIELRNSTWYSENYKESMLAFMKEKNFSLVIVDEPQIPTNPVPFFPYITNKEKVLFRFHGRNATGWLANDKDWRKKRTLYRYDSKEISELSDTVKALSLESEEVGVIFNNNSGGDAADNVLAMKARLNLQHNNQLNHPKQLGLFD
ncbi:DUF72 domain-containing protein [Melissococcus plutonius]|uniref:UPF0759 protein YunF n=1 Tax=Melissococcus plutonius TaxID=33970 RepID=A0A2Z5Y0W6_9ENTE|nr:DUF72 domain-containing protein [Melissococcus plutonius]BAL61566.1 hypothetical protein MPD5_0285 [Melissococcus plutonius DAT561]MCV2498487.1 DUF72 domain-containing protein [Melissococcus plutonius]MCV2501247.1 DUF72 domain-containing protein [Melissococcus plutonius]MCV2505511.1 DUF72 domain-containing protein [Melissococcus plutonius]MCV2507102.1 DUF72 domain-containing protein [Melissococcus plutonius]